MHHRDSQSMQNTCVYGKDKSYPNNQDEQVESEQNFVINSYSNQMNSSPHLSRPSSFPMVSSTTSTPSHPSMGNFYARATPSFPRNVFNTSLPPFNGESRDSTVCKTSIDNVRNNMHRMTPFSSFNANQAGMQFASSSHRYPPLPGVGAILAQNRSLKDSMNDGVWERPDSTADPGIGIQSQDFHYSSSHKGYIDAQYASELSSQEAFGSLSHRALRDERVISDFRNKRFQHGFISLPNSTYPGRTGNHGLATPMNKEICDCNSTESSTNKKDPLSPSTSTSSQGSVIGKDSSKRRERWTTEEHEKFLEGLEKYGRKWKKIQTHVKTKTAVQVRTHAYGYFAKLLRNMPEEGGVWEVAQIMSSLPSSVIKGPGTGKRRSEPATDEKGMDVLRKYVFAKRKHTNEKRKAVFSAALSAAKQAAITVDLSDLPDRSHTERSKEKTEEDKLEYSNHSEFYERPMEFQNTSEKRPREIAEDSHRKRRHTISPLVNIKSERVDSEERNSVAESKCLGDVTPTQPIIPSVQHT